MLAFNIQLSAEPCTPAAIQIGSCCIRGWRNWHCTALSLTYVHGHDLKKGLQLVKSLTSKPFGMNVIVEQSSKAYEERMRGQ